MILVDIQIPILDKVFDFELDEGTKVETLLADILTLAARDEQLEKSEDELMFLYGMRQEGILGRKETLEYQGVRDGDRLILI